MLCNFDGNVQLHPMHRPLTGAGFAYYSDGPIRKNVFGFGHLAAGRRLPYLADPQVAGFIQTFTSTSDTAFRADRKIRQFLKASGVDFKSTQSRAIVLDILSQDFPYFTEDALKALFVAADG